jgi:iron-sulfur cluster insertion protein
MEQLHDDSGAPAAAPPQVSLSQSAARRIAELMTAEGEKGLKFRVAVSGGGCSGFQYGFSFDSDVKEDDRVFRSGGVEFLVDEISLELLAGAEIDWVEDLAGAAFQVRNPLAKSGCGCGSSFSI